MNVLAHQMGTPARAPGLYRADPTFDLTLAGRCVPSGRAGRPVAGDFYDAFRLDERRLLVVVGDVAGHGLGAGARMRQLRASIRRVARWTTSPAELLGVLDKTYVLGDEDDIATAWIGVYDNDTSLLRYAGAGHPPPVLAEIGGRPRLLAAASAPPLGTGAVAAHVRDHEVLWPAGALLVAYSDGLVERPHRDLEDQIHQLRTLVGRTYAADVDAAPHVLAEQLLDSTFRNAAASQDDVCILVLRRDAAPPLTPGSGGRRLSSASRLVSGAVG
jgi:serine phosphatase RsbU (regulator of sigma subunit)